VTQNKDGNFVVPITKDQAKSMAAYSYSDPSLRGKLLGENGSVYTSPSNGTAAANANMMNATTTSVNASTEYDSVVNADGSFNSSRVVGLTVQNSNNDSIGKIDELLIDKGGQVSGVVVDVGGFLGMGARPVKLDWKQVKLVEQDGSTVAMVDASKDTLKAMPEYKAQ
jgi:sporulation protein YlmC with PRC-barrel domain